MEDYDVCRLSLRELAQILLGGYVIIFGVTLLFFASLILSFAAGLLSVFLIPMYKNYLKEKRKRLLMTQFKDLLYSISSSVACGRSMGKALEEGEHNLSLMYKEDTPMMKELSHINRSLKYHRGSEEKLLRDFARRSHLEDIENFTEVYCACLNTGGNVERIILDTVEIISEKMTIMREISMITSQKQFEGRIIALMPLLVILGLRVFYPEYIDVLYTCLAGRMVMLAALGGIVAAGILIQKLTDIQI